MNVITAGLAGKTAAMDLARGTVRRFRIIGAACAVVIGLLSYASLARAQTEETPEVLPEGPGREETFYGCTACHGTAIIRQQGMTRERWDETLRVMTSKHGMAEYDGEMRGLILDYLAANFPQRRRAPTNPFLQ